MERESTCCLDSQKHVMYKMLCFFAFFLLYFDEVVKSCPLVQMKHIPAHNFNRIIFSQKRLMLKSEFVANHLYRCSCKNELNPLAFIETVNICSEGLISGRLY